MQSTDTTVNTSWSMELVLATISCLEPGNKLISIQTWIFQCIEYCMTYKTNTLLQFCAFVCFVFLKKKCLQGQYMCCQSFDVKKLNLFCSRNLYHITLSRFDEN